MKKVHWHFSRIVFGLILIFIALVGWEIYGSVAFVALLLLGLIKFLGGILYAVTGKVPFGPYRNTLIILLVGAVVGFVIFDIPSIYLFKVWTYQAGIPNPFANFLLYAVQSLGWGAFFMVFYDSYKIIHLALDKSFPNLCLTRRRGAHEGLFSLLGIAGIGIFIFALFLGFLGFTRVVWPPTLAAIGVWFILENIEFRKTGTTLLLSILQGHVTPLLSIIIGSFGVGIIFEYFNIIAPKQLWIYYGLPFGSFNLVGVPLFLLLSWAWMYVIFLSLYGIMYRKENLWS